MESCKSGSQIILIIVVEKYWRGKFFGKFGKCLAIGQVFLHQCYGTTENLPSYLPKFSLLLAKILPLQNFPTYGVQPDQKISLWSRVQIQAGCTQLVRSTGVFMSVIRTFYKMLNHLYT